MIDKDILEGISELNESDLKRLKLLIDNKLNLEEQTKVSFRQKTIKCGKEACKTCPHGPYWYAEWTDKGSRKSKYIGKQLYEDE